MLINVITVLKYYEYAGYSGLYVSLSKDYKIFTALPIIILFLYITNVLKTNSKVIKITIFAMTAGQYLFLLIFGSRSMIMIFQIPIFVAFLIAIWGEWKDYSRLEWKIIPICIALILYFFYFIQRLTRLRDGFDYGWAAGDIAQMLFCIALLIFIQLTDLPKNIEKLPPKRALEVLKKLGEGVIREDEYQAKRAEIIKKL